MTAAADAVGLADELADGDRLDASGELAGVVREAAAARMPAPRRTAGAGDRADAAFVAAAGVPTVMLGPGGEGAHVAEEWARRSDTDVVARTLAAVAARRCA